MNIDMNLSRENTIEAVNIFDLFVAINSLRF